MYTKLFFILLFLTFSSIVPMEKGPNAGALPTTQSQPKPIEEDYVLVEDPKVLEPKEDFWREFLQELKKFVEDLLATEVNTDWLR